MHLLAGWSPTWLARWSCAGHRRRGNDVLFLTGPSPTACGARSSPTVELALSFDVKRVIGLGAYPAPVPHTRASRLSITTSSQDVSDTLPELQRGTLEVPAGVFAALDEEFNASGIPSFRLWAQVPHYASNLPSPGGGEGTGRAVMERGSQLHARGPRGRGEGQPSALGCFAGVEPRASATGRAAGTGVGRGSKRRCRVHVARRSAALRRGTGRRVSGVSARPRPRGLSPQASAVDRTVPNRSVGALGVNQTCQEGRRADR
ncbi:MAG: PAC2 family protein [Candidatus Microthrix sp.]|nr:PAC2 family protein [Candidatus Microthrix sp.]